MHDPKFMGMRLAQIVETGAEHGGFASGMWGDLHLYDLRTARGKQIGVPDDPRPSLLTPSPDGESFVFFRLAGGDRRAIWMYQSGQKESRLFQEF